MFFGSILPRCLLQASKSLPHPILPTVENEHRDRIGQVQRSHGLRDYCRQTQGRANISLNSVILIPWFSSLPGIGEITAR